MAETLPNPQDCCQPCSTVVTTTVPGPAGSEGAAGADGTSGKSSTTLVSGIGGFTQPASSGTVAVTVSDSSQFSVNSYVFIANGGFYKITAIGSGTQITVQNLGVTGNVAPGSNIPQNSLISPSGPPGATGATGVSTLNAVSPTTTKGDIIVDNGVNNPLASDVRLGVGTDGQVLASDSAQSTGLAWKTVSPNVAATDGDIAIFSGTTGKPMAIKDSKLLIDSTGAIQSTPSGGNARGTSAIDLQVVRSGATEVASGAESTIAGGQNNTASGANSVVSGGTTNTASAANSTVGGGTTNTASAASATVAGGNGNTSSGQGSFTAGESNVASGTDSESTGSNNTASANYSSAKGLQSLAVLHGQRAIASGRFSAQGDAQISDVIMRNTTAANTTPVLLFLDGASAKLVVPTNKSWAVSGMVIGRIPNGVATYGGLSAIWTFTGGIKNLNTTVSLIGASLTIVTAGNTPVFKDTSWPGGSIAIGLGSANDLQIQVTGTATAIVNWVARISLTEVLI